MAAVERWERQLRERLAAAPNSERAGILLEAVELAKPLIASRQITRARSIAIMEACAREHGIITLKSANDDKPSPLRPKGLFSGPPFHDNGPEAA